MIDADGYRPNVGIILGNVLDQVLWAKRAGQSGWQFPQGGIKSNEGPEDALFRELDEEIGLSVEQVQILGCTQGWLRYQLPAALRRNEPSFRGQKQKWFLLRMLGTDDDVRFDHADKPEFDAWHWVSYWYPLGQVVSFKQQVYRQAMKELLPCLEAPPHA